MKKNLYRIIFWGLIMALCIAAGVLGVIRKNAGYSESKAEIDYIVKAFNASSAVQIYYRSGVIITADIDGKDLVVNYDGGDKVTYKFKYYSGYLQTTINQSDAFAIVMLKVIAESINEYYGDKTQSIGSVFEDNSKLLLYTFDNGMEFSPSEGNYIVKLRLGKPINLMTTALPIDDEENNIDNNEDNPDNTIIDVPVESDEPTSVEDIIDNTN